MPEKWTGEIVGALHVYGVTAKELAEKLGYNSKYLSSVLNGHKTPRGAEEKVRKALNELLGERKMGE